MERGDLITGKDRSYRRSIYRIERVNGKAGMFTLSLVCFNGRRGDDDELYKRDIDEFRLASKEEVFKELGEVYQRELIHFVETLLKL